MADQAAPVNLGNETDAQFILRPEWAPDYQNPDGGDLFETLNFCINAVWGRAIRDNLRYINRVFRCEQSTPLSDLICNAPTNATWRPSDDGSYAIQAADFAAAGVLAPSNFWNLDGDFVPQFGTPTLRQDEGSQKRVYTWKSVLGRDGASGGRVIGLRTFHQWGAWSDPFDAGIVDSPSIAGSITCRIPEWNQANNGIVLMAVKHKRDSAETGATDRMGWEFGLGALGFGPSTDPREYALYLRYRTAADAEKGEAASIIDSSATSQPIGITPGNEWTLGFHRRESSPGFYQWDFYINGVLSYTSDAYDAPSFGSSTDIRLLVGGGSDGVKFVGGPIRNVALWRDTDDAAAVGAAMLFVYQKGAGWMP
jgi:hypothetical protein